MRRDFIVGFLLESVSRREFDPTVVKHDELQLSIECENFDAASAKFEQIKKLLVDNGIKSSVLTTSPKIQGEN